MEKIFVNVTEIDAWSEFNKEDWVRLNMKKSTTEGGAMDEDIKPVGGQESTHP